MGRVALSADVVGVHGFGVALTSFVGRAREVDELAGLLAAYRLVTVTGPGGVGKTRLAAEVARRVAGRFADGVWLAELAGVSEPELVPAAVATALGLQQAPGVPVTDSLVALLARQQLLLVLDNCEHVLASVADLCGVLLPVADDVRFLLTSREPVGIGGEGRYRLAPLGLPASGGPEGIAGSDAVALFADRARGMDSHFTLSSESGPVVARLVERLDGMPLAIELAAARVEALGVTQLLDRLDDGLRLLAGGNRLAAHRHRSLAAAADWSYRLLTEPEQRVFRQLAIFPGPFTLEAAETVAEADTAPAVLHLVDCSLVTPPRVGPDRRARYLMLETLRTYGRERLTEAGEQPLAAARLAAYALKVAESAAAGLAASLGERAAATWLDAEDATVHQGLAWALEHDRGTALELATALAPWWVLRSRYAAGYALLARAAEHAPAGGKAWCRAQLWLGNLAQISGTAASLAHFSAVSEAPADGPEPPVLARALAERAGCLANLGQLPEAAAEARRALTLAEEVGDPVAAARARYWRGGVAMYMGEPEEGLLWLRRAQQTDPASIPGSLVRRCITGLANALIGVGEPSEAQQYCTRGLMLARQAGELFDQSDCLVLMTDVDLRVGRIPEAKAHLREAIELASRFGDPLFLVDCLNLCGHLCEHTQRWADALTAWAAAAAIREAVGMVDPPHDARRRAEPLQRARQALGHQRASAAEQRGVAMRVSTAAEYAALLAVEDRPELRQPAPGPLSLSARERELVTLVAKGQTNAQIAGQLFISIRTVSSHLDRIRAKTGCRRRADLTRLALQADLV